MKTKLIIIFCLLILAAAVIGVTKRWENTKSPTPNLPAQHYSHEITVGPQTLFVDIATTEADMAQGLSDRTSMADNQGMLFDFKTQLIPSFWMKDMNFALDFLWVSNGKIIYITNGAPPAPKNADGSFNDNNLPLYTPPSPVNVVIEVNAGWAQKNNITVNDVVKEIN